MEEQEVVDYFPALKKTLGLDRPDFALLSKDGLLSAVVECKNDYRELDIAVEQSKTYAESINKQRSYDVRIAVGAAGTPDRLVRTRVLYRLDDGEWVPLKSHGYALTQLPTADELQTAIDRNNGTTDVELPTEHEFFDAAIKINRILRLAKIEESSRPRTIGSIILALYHEDFNTRPGTV